MAACPPPCRNRAGPLGTNHRSTSRHLSWLQEMGQGFPTATLGHSPSQDPCVAHPIQGSSPPLLSRRLPPQTTLNHHNFLAKTLGSPEGQWKFIYFFVLSISPQVAFPCKMPDTTPEGILGLGGHPKGQPRDLNTSWRAGHGWDRQETAQVHGFSGRDQRFVFLQEEAVSEGRGLGSQVGGGKWRGPPNPGMHPHSQRSSDRQ